MISFSLLMDSFLRSHICIREVFPACFLKLNFSAQLGRPVFPNLFLLVFPTGNWLTSLQGSAGIVLGTDWTVLALNVLLYSSEIHDNLSLESGVLAMLSWMRTMLKCQVPHLESCMAGLHHLSLGPCWVDGIQPEV